MISAGASPSKKKYYYPANLSSNIENSFNSLIIHDDSPDNQLNQTHSNSSVNSVSSSNINNTNNNMKRSSKSLNLSNVDDNYYLNSDFKNFKNLNLNLKLNKFKRPHILISNSPSPSKKLSIQEIKNNGNNENNDIEIEEIESDLDESPSKFNITNLNFLKKTIIKKNSNKLRKTINLNKFDDIKYEFDKSPSKSKKFKKKNYVNNTPLKELQTFNSIHREREKENTSNTPTPNSYKFVKPLQTVFNSTGLLKKNFTDCKDFDNSMTIPETPVKKMIDKDKKNELIINNEELKNCISNFNNDFNDFNNVESIFKFQEQEQEIEKTPTKNNNQNSDEYLINKFGFKNINFLGEGEYSIVYECNFHKFKYAIKRSKRRLIGNLEIKNFTREVEILSKLSNKNENKIEDKIENEEGKEYIINFIESWEYNNYYYIMSEFCENNTLEIFLKENKNIKLDEFRIWKILIEISIGLNYIHSQDIIHLDLKPANIFITFEGSLKIGDFGLSTTTPVSNEFDLEGDRNYIAPELIERKLYTKYADIFSLGLIILEIATNIILPENGTPWRKLRSGDLSDAGKLSCDNINEYLNHINLSNISNLSNLSNITNTSITNTLNSNTNTNASTSTSSIFTNDKMKLIPNWAPIFLLNNGGNIDKLVNKMLRPEVSDRLSATEILATEECILIENRRKAGALIFEGEFGPRPDDE